MCLFVCLDTKASNSDAIVLLFRPSFKTGTKYVYRKYVILSVFYFISISMGQEYDCFFGTNLLLQICQTRNKWWFYMKQQLSDTKLQFFSWVLWEDKVQFLQQSWPSMVHCSTKSSLTNLFFDLAFSRYNIRESWRMIRGKGYNIGGTRYSIWYKSKKGRTFTYP